MNQVLRYVILSLLVLLPHLGWGQVIWHEDMGSPLGLKFIDIGSTAIFLQQDPLAEKYYNLSPYAYSANNPVNFVDPDGKFPIVLPIGAILLKSAAISGGLILTTAWAIDKWEQSYDSSKYNPGFEHQKERDRRNKIQ